MTFSFLLCSQTLGVWPDNPSRSALVELMAKYFLQTLPRNIFAYYHDRVTCQKHKTCFVQFCYYFKKHPKMSTNNRYKRNSNFFIFLERNAMLTKTFIYARHGIRT